MLALNGVNITPITADSVLPGDFIPSVDQNKKLVDYIVSRVQSDVSNRNTRIQRYARADRMVAGYQRLSEEDTIRQGREDKTGQPQGIAIVMPVADMHVEETAAFFTEIFAPASGSFYSNQGDDNQVGQIQELATLMENDYKLDGYYDSVASVMRTLLKYNVGGFELTWLDADDEAVGSDKIGGNRAAPVDMYNLFYDPSIIDVKTLGKEGEWYATISQKSRLWLIRGSREGTLSQVDKVIESRTGTNEPMYQADFYKRPADVAGLNSSGRDDGTAPGGGAAVDWDSFGLGLAGEKGSNIEGHEVIDCKIWLIPNQFELKENTSEGEDLALYRVRIADGKYIISIDEIDDMTELPIYMAFLRADEMQEAQKSYAEALRGFQRHISFMANTAIAAERGNTYGQKAVDPSMFDIEGFKSGETAGVIASKQPGRDVRSGIMRLDLAQDTNPLYSAIASMIGFMKEFYPNQGIPAQVAGMERAITSQVAAVLIGAVRRLHVLVRRLDSSMMNPLRVASFRNYVKYHPDASKFSSLTEKDVARLLNSGLGQLNREVAAAAIERLLFTLIQNPASAAGFDLPKLFRIWSQMLNTGQDLGKMVSPQAAAGSQSAQEPVDPNTAPQTQGGATTEGQG